MDGLKYYVIFTVLCYLSTQVSVKGSECTGGWQSIHRACYKFNKDDKKTWQEALDACNLEGGSLISIGSALEYQHVLKELQKIISTNKIVWWVGLKRDKTSGKFVEWLDKSHFSRNVTKWAPGEPNNVGNKEDCVEIVNVNGKLNDNGCLQKFPYVCELNETCDFGMYGPGCTKLCSERKCLVGTSSCNNINGKCEGGCKEGIASIDCVKGCDEGWYGEGCSKKCSDRKCKNNNVECDSKTGECIDGCQPGYQSLDCTLECDYGTYGQDCQSNCSARFCQCQFRHTCSPINGACDCLEGYQGPDCTVKKEAVRGGDEDGNSGSGDETGTIVGIIVALIIGIIIGIITGTVVIPFIKRRRLNSKSKSALPDRVTSNRPRNNVTNHVTTSNRSVTQLSSNISNHPVTQPASKSSNHSVTQPSSNSSNHSVTQPSSNTSNIQDEHQYGQLNTIYQNENAYELLQKP